MFGGYAGYDAGRVQIIIKGPAFSEEFGGEDDVFVLERGSESDGDGGFDDDSGFRRYLVYLGDDAFYGGGVEVMGLGIVVGRGGNDDEVGTFCFVYIEGGFEVQFFV